MNFEKPNLNNEINLGENKKPEPPKGSAFKKAVNTAVLGGVLMSATEGCKPGEEPDQGIGPDNQVVETVSSVDSQMKDYMDSLLENLSHGRMDYGSDGTVFLEYYNSFVFLDNDAQSELQGLIRRHLNDFNDSWSRNRKATYFEALRKKFDLHVNDLGVEVNNQNELPDSLQPRFLELQKLISKQNGNNSTIDKSRFPNAEELPNGVRISSDFDRDADF